MPDVANEINYLVPASAHSTDLQFFSSCRPSYVIGFWQHFRCCFFMAPQAPPPPNGPGPPHSLMFLDHTQWRTPVGRTSLDEWSARRTDLYLTAHNTHNRHPCPRWDSNAQSQQASGRRRTPLTARPLGPDISGITYLKFPRTGRTIEINPRTVEWLKWYDEMEYCLTLMYEVTARSKVVIGKLLVAHFFKVFPGFYGT